MLSTYPHSKALLCSHVGNAFLVMRVLVYDTVDLTEQDLKPETRHARTMIARGFLAYNDEQ